MICRVFSLHGSSPVYKCIEEYVMFYKPGNADETCLSV